jgi:hypothetical protein
MSEKPKLTKRAKRRNERTRKKLAENENPTPTRRQRREKRQQDRARIMDEAPSLTGTGMSPRDQIKMRLKQRKHFLENKLGEFGERREKRQQDRATRRQRRKTVKEKAGGGKVEVFQDQIVRKFGGGKIKT